MDWLNIAIQAGGAIAVCAMFLWFLTKKQQADDAARKEFLAHLREKDAAASDVLQKHLAYMRERDKQSKEIAKSGHETLSEVAKQVEALRAELAQR